MRLKKSAFIIFLVSALSVYAKADDPVCGIYHVQGHLQKRDTMTWILINKETRSEIKLRITGADAKKFEFLNDKFISTDIQIHKVISPYALEAQILDLKKIKVVAFNLLKPNDFLKLTEQKDCQPSPQK